MKNVRRSINAWIGLALAVILGASACAPAAQPTPTPTAVPDTPTPSLTPTPAATATPTATPTPAGTPTQLPAMTPAAEGTGNVAGLVLWNDRPVTKAAVWLCVDFTYSGCNSYKTNTDRNGYYVFENVKPGEYVVAMNSFGSSWFIFYFDAGGSKQQTVSAGNDLILDPWNIWKLNLSVISPRSGKVISEEFPTFAWEPYPDAAYYEITLYDDKGNYLLEGKRVNGTEFMPEDPLVSCGYSWTVEAFNERGTILAHNKPGIYSTIMDFNNINLPTGC